MKLSIARRFFALSGLCAVIAVGGVVPTAGIAGTPQPVAAPDGGTIPVSVVLDRLNHRNGDLRSFQSHVHAEFHLHSFPYIREHLDGTAYYKHPENYALVFTHVPSYMRGFGKLSTDMSSPATWNSRYVVTYAGTRVLEGRNELVLRLVAKKGGQIDHQDVLIDPEVWSIDEMDWHYYNGGTISMRQHYRSEGAYRLIAAQDALIMIPYVRATVHAEYSGYQTNVAVSDSIFVAQR